MIPRRRQFYHNGNGAAAVEFAIVAPVFILMLFGMIAFGLWLSAAHTVQQVASGAARSCVAGLDSDEREQLAEAYVANALSADSLIDPDLVDIAVHDDPDVPENFRVTVTYDASNLPIWSLLGSSLLPGRKIRRETVVMAGGI